MANLMQLGFDLDNVITLIQDNDGVLTPETEKQLEAVQTEITHKVDNVGFSVVMKEKEIEAMKVIEQSIAAKRRALENDLSRFKIWLSDCVRNFGIDAGYSAKVLKGNVVTIKDNTKEVLTYDSDRVKDSHKVDVITIEVPRTDEIKNKTILNFITKHETKRSTKVNTENVTSKDEGFSYEVRKAVTFLGLKKLNTTLEEN